MRGRARANEGTRARARRGVGAGVTVFVSVPVSGRAGVRVRQRLLFSFCSCLFVSFPVTAKHDRTHSQTFLPSQTLGYFSEFLCAPAVCHAVVLDVVKIPTYVPTLQGKGTFDSGREHRVEVMGLGRPR